MPPAARFLGKKRGKNLPQGKVEKSIRVVIGACKDFNINSSAIVLQVKLHP